MKQLNSWFEIDEQEYLMYLLKGYVIEAGKNYITWMLDGEIHREDGPAIIFNHVRSIWYINDRRHRIDGPAVIWEDGRKEWWLNGKRYSEYEFNEAVKQLV